jgi:cAMP phosphodiesterase
LPIVALVRLEQLSKALSPILVTLSGIIMLVKPVPENTDSPMLVILQGIVISIRPEHLLKALSPM